MLKVLRPRDPYPTDAVRDKAATRVSRIPEDELLDWADVAGSGIARALREYQSRRDPRHLIEAREAVSALQGVIDDLARRAGV